MGQVTLEVGHLGILVFSIIRRARQEAMGSVVPSDPCQEMEPQGAEYRRGLWLEEVGEAGQLTLLQQVAWGPTGLQQDLGRLGRVCPSLAGA